MTNAIPGMKRLKHVRTLSGLWKYRSELLQMFRDMFARRYKASFLTRVALLAGLLYILFPFDFIPDWIPVVGWLDDGAIFYFLVKRLIGELDRYQQSRTQLRVVKY